MPTGNGQIPRDTQTAKNDSEKIENLKGSITGRD